MTGIEERERRTVEEAIEFATAGVRLSGGTVTEADKSAARRVLIGTSTAQEELADYLRELRG
ncbi:hypothetical protein [Rhodococcus sp. NPDC058481]|uniref:hypothetical protein n=1 Tax=unclassified Rhodococcus (in: high G+C Gram-positive bacteria) TaxID=192944 RepID=UPI003652BA98